jgi:hypothetical protein
MGQEGSYGSHFKGTPRNPQREENTNIPNWDQGIGAFTRIDHEEFLYLKTTLKELKRGGLRLATSTHRIIFDRSEESAYLMWGEQRIISPVNGNHLLCYALGKALELYREGGNEELKSLTPAQRRFTQPTNNQNI